MLTKQDLKQITGIVKITTNPLFKRVDGLEDKIDKGFAQVDKRFTEVNKQFQILNKN